MEIHTITIQTVTIEIKTITIHTNTVTMEIHTIHTITMEIHTVHTVTMEIHTITMVLELCYGSVTWGSSKPGSPPPEGRNQQPGVSRLGRTDTVL
ncbi:unnamed protein product [Gadus morhua 'NCC']